MWIMYGPPCTDKGAKELILNSTRAMNPSCDQMSQTTTTEHQLGRIPTYSGVGPHTILACMFVSLDPNQTQQELKVVMSGCGPGRMARPFALYRGCMAFGRNAENKSKMSC